MKTILLLNGPNLNMLGKREPHIYGSQTLSDIEQHLKQQAEAQGFAFDYFQANGEEPLINRIHQGFQKVDFIIINQVHLLTPALPCVMLYYLSLFLLLKFIYPTYTPVNLSATTLI